MTIYYHFRILRNLLVFASLILAALAQPVPAQESSEIPILPGTEKSGPRIAMGFAIDPQDRSAEATSQSKHWFLNRGPLTNSSSAPRPLVYNVEVSAWVVYRSTIDDKAILGVVFMNLTKNKSFLQDFFFQVRGPREIVAPEVTDDDLGGDGILSPGEMSKAMVFEFPLKTKATFFLQPWARMQCVLEPPCEGCCAPCSDNQDTVFSAGSEVEVLPHSGELTVDAVDLEIPGRAFNWRFERKYRSLVPFDGALGGGSLGAQWEHNYERRMVEVNGNNFTQVVAIVTNARIGDVLDVNGAHRGDLYLRNRDGSYTSPVGFYSTLIKTADGGFVERHPDGRRIFYSPPDVNGVARMTEIVDRNLNTMVFEHDAQGRLVRVIDTLGRAIDYFYNADGLLVEVRDFLDRSLRFAHDRYRNVVAVTGPAVVGTPNGNDFLGGKTVRYAYGPKKHLLKSITAPNEVAADGPPRVAVAYDEVNRVASLTVGGVNAGGVPAGGTLTYDYHAFIPGPGDPATAVSETLVRDRNGNETRYLYDPLGDVVRSREFTNRDVRAIDADFFETITTWNDDSERTLRREALGNAADATFDRSNPDRHQQGNVTATVLLPDEARGGDQTFIRTTSTYEPIYNQIRSMTEARGNDPGYVPQNGGETSPERYTTRYTFDFEESCDFAAIGERVARSTEDVEQLLAAAGMCAAPLGDVNGDGRTSQISGNVIGVQHPSVRLLPGSNQAAVEGDEIQEIVELYTYNRFGQRLSVTDPEGNVDLFEYYPEQDPDGDGVVNNPAGDPATGGYLKQVTRDAVSAPGRNSGTNPPPTEIRTLRLYDPVGNVVREVDGRGIATDFFVNELNQVVQTTLAAAHGVFEPDPPEPEELVDFKYLERIFYDFNGNVILRQVEDRGDTSNTGGFVDYGYAYDILDNQIEMREEVSVDEVLVTRYRYDANANQVLVIQPEGNATASVYDERDLLFQTTRGALSPPPDAILAAGDPKNYDVRGGVPSTMTYHYDLNRNLIESVDAADTDGSADNNSDLGGFGDRTRYILDGFDRRTSVVDSVGNQSVTQYNPAGSVVRHLRFGPVGGPSPVSDGPDVLPVPVSSRGIIQAANLVNASALEATESLYDELHRLLQTDRVLFVNTIPTVRPLDVADGASDSGKGDLTPDDNEAIPGIGGITILGRVSSRNEYDRSSRTVFTVEDDEDTFRTFYDGADRVIRTVDPENNIVEMAYDDNDNVIESRETDVSQVAGIANELYLTTTFYDILNRVQRTVDNIGQTTDYRYDSRDNVAAMADAQGPVTGSNIARRAFGSGALTVNDINDFGNATVYFYDGINRKFREYRVLTVSGNGDGLHIGADMFGVRSPTPTPDPAQSADGLITIQYDWDLNSLLSGMADDNGNRTQYTYDNLNRRSMEILGICEAPALADRCDQPTTIIYDYDSDYNVVRLIDENGSVVTHRFDAMNRSTAWEVSRAAHVLGTTDATYEYDGISRLVKATDNNEPSDASDDSTITYAYDSVSRIIEETQRLGMLQARITSSSWLAEGLRKDLTYPNGRVVEYTYDQLDRLDTIGDQGADQVIADYDYIGSSRVARRRFPTNNTKMTYLNDEDHSDGGYDGVRRPVQLRHMRTNNSLIVGFSHSYDRMNNKLSENKLHNLTNSETYGYDSAFRVVDFDRPAPGAIEPFHDGWKLDGAGNWREVVTTKSGNPLVETRQHSSFNELVRRDDVQNVELEYDNNGNQIDNGNFFFEYDYRNRLRSVSRKTDGVLISTYSYDDAGRRIRKVEATSNEPDSKVHFYYDSWQVIEERLPDQGAGADVLAQQYVFGIYIDEPLILDRVDRVNGNITEPGDLRFFFHQNTLASVFALTDTSGRIVEGYLYEAYGRQTIYEPGRNGVVDFGGDDVVTANGFGSSRNPYMFTGRRLDSETRLYHYRVRYYGPEQGRHTQRDPLGYQDGSNLYEYVRGRPLRNVDPTGMSGGDFWNDEDFWERVHRFSGRTLGKMRTPPFLTLFLLAGWEFAEPHIFESLDLPFGEQAGLKGGPEHDIQVGLEEWFRARDGVYPCGICFDARFGPLRAVVGTVIFNGLGWFGSGCTFVTRADVVTGVNAEISKHNGKVGLPVTYKKACGQKFGEKGIEQSLKEIQACPCCHPLTAGIVDLSAGFPKTTVVSSPPPPCRITMGLTVNQRFTGWWGDCRPR